MNKLFIVIICCTKYNNFRCSSIVVIAINLVCTVSLGTFHILLSRYYRRTDDSLKLPYASMESVF